MKISPLALAHMSAYTAAVLGVVGSNFSVDASPSATIRSHPLKLKTLLSKFNPRAIYPTAIGRDVAVTHPETQGSLHGIVGQVERNLASRRLLINQDDAAKKVQDAIAAANEAVTKGETSGVALPLDYVVFDGQDTLQFLSVRLRLPGVDRDQNVVIDTGSSALAFCNKSLIDEAKNISKTKYAKCNTYDTHLSCPDSSTGGYFLAFAGQIFRGDVGVYSDQGEEVASMDNVSFTIMDFEQFGNPCSGPLDGIIGVAYMGTGFNTAVELPSPDFNVSSLWNVSCPNPDQGDFSKGFKTIGNCDSGNMTNVNLKPPLEQALEQDYSSGRISAAAFGLYLDYAATVGSEVGTIVPSLGIYFGGDLAYDNQYYNDGKVQVAATIYNDLTGFTHYWLNFTSIRVPSLNLTQSTVDLCSEDGRCITDTGNSGFDLPLPQEVCDTLMSTSVDELKGLGSLFIDLPAADGKDGFTLSFPLLWLREQLGLDRVTCNPKGDFTLGLPITQYYYTVYDMGNHTVSFVELNLSNETKTFIDGPELGGTATDGDGTTTISPTPQPTSKGCFCHTFGLGLLAWTVLVPSVVALITITS